MRYQDIGDPPDIANTLATGYPSRKKAVWPRCPVCGENCDTMYLDWYGKYIGCNVCVDKRDAWEVDDCFPGRW